MRTYASLYTLDMNAIKSDYFLYQLYEREYLTFITMEKDIKHASYNDVHATHLSHNIDNHLEVRCSTPHFTALIITLQHLFYKLERAAIHITLKH